jgi:ubiquinone/menaquinone biosynthesis C-methylase UbiE
MAENSKLTIGIEPFTEKFINFSKIKNTNLFFAANSGSKLCFKDSSFDLTVFCQSLHHIEITQQKKALTEAWRILKTKGTLLVIEPLHNKGLYGQIIALISKEKEMKENAQEEIRNLNSDYFEKLSHKNLKIEYLIDDYNNFYDSKIKNKTGINWDKSIEQDIKKILSDAPKKNGKLSIDCHYDIFSFKKI